MFSQTAGFSILFLALYSLVCAVPTVKKRGGLTQVITECRIPRTAALTFDDGPYVYLKDVVNILNAAGAKGTFFFNGHNFACIYTPDAVERVQYAYGHGHQIGSHTWSHAHLPTLNESTVDSEFQRVEVALHKILGIIPAFTRPPYGETNEFVLQVAAAHEQTLVTWNFDSGDSLGKTAEQSKALYKEFVQGHPSSVLALNHEVYESTVKNILPYAIDILQQAGYKLITVADCLGERPYLSVDSPSTRDSTWTC